MYTFSVFKLLFILISLAEVRMSLAEGRSFNSFDITKRTWTDAVAYCKQLNGSYQLIGIPDYTGIQIASILSVDQSGFIWFNCHLLQNSSLNTEYIKCRKGSGSVVYEESTVFADEGLGNVQNNNSCLAYNRGFTMKDCSDEGIVQCISDESSSGSQATDIPQDTTSFTFQESSEAVTTVSSSLKTINTQSSPSLMSGLTNPSSTDDQTTMTTDHVTSQKQTTDPPDLPDATSVIGPQATNISPTRDFLSSTLQESTEAVASGVSSTVNTSPGSTRSATTPSISGLTSAESTEDGDDPVPSQGSPTILRGTSISSTTAEKESSTAPQGSESPPSSTTTSSRVRPPNLVSTIFKKNVSQKQGSCGTGDGFPVRSVLRCAAACLGATEHPCQGYDVNRKSDGGLECVLNTGSGHAHSECDFFKYM